MNYSDRLHPSTVLACFGMLLLLSMTAKHPAVLLVLLLFSFCLYMTLFGVRKAFGLVPVGFALLVAVVFINLVFVHKGEHIFLFMRGRPLTYEAALSGLFSGIMILTVLLYCRCLSELLPGERIIGTMGKVFPHLALLLSMAIGFLPRFTRQYKDIGDARKVLASGMGTGTEKRKVKGGLTVFSVLISRMLEESMEKADAMSARGYGLPGATTATLKKYTARDSILLALILILGLGSFILSLLGAGDWSWYPISSLSSVFPCDFAYFITTVILAGIPLLLEGKEALKWQFLNLKK